MSSTPSRSAFVRSFAIVAVAGLAACGGTDTVVPPAKDVTPASVVAVSSDTIRGAVGAQGSLPLTVIVKNKAGDLLDTTLVTFAVTSGGGSLSNVSVRTNASGQASTQWILGGTAGLQTATATVGTLPAVTFAAVATAGPAATMTKLAGDAQSAVVGTAVTTPPSVKVVDKFGNPVAGVQVAFSVASGGGNALPLAVTTGADGVAKLTSWTLGSVVGSNTLTASAGALSVTFTATATVGAPARITLTPTSVAPQIVGQTVQLTARVFDAIGNVIPNAAVTYSSSATSVATVSTSGLVTFVGAGTATITATSGTVSASVAVSAIGHPAGTTIASSIDLQSIPPGDILFTTSAMLVAIPAQQKVLVYDPTGTTLIGTALPQTGISKLLAPTRAAGPAVVVNSGATSQLTFIDPASATVTGQLTLNDLVNASAMTSDGSKIFAMLSDGSLSVVDAATQAQTAVLQLGGGVQRLLLVGDTTLYALTNVGVMFDIDVRTNTVRQRPANVTATDVAVGPDGYFYLLDGPTGTIRVFNPATLTVIRGISVPANAATLSVSPDGQQIWVTVTDPLEVAIYTGSITNGFLPTATILTGTTQATRVSFNATGSVAAIGNLGGRIDIVR